MESTVIKAIQQQIDEASPILEKITYLTSIPTRPGHGNASSTLGKKPYDKRIVSKIEEEISRWQYATKTVLATCFGAGSDHYREFENTIADNHGLFLDAKEDLEAEVNKGRSSLSAIIEAESKRMQFENVSTLNEDQLKIKKPLVFISHSGKQELFVSALVSLLKDCGFTKDTLFCSSVPGFNIGLDEDIIETLRKKLVDYKIYVVYVFSNEFFESPYCLNEMGAAWVLQVDNSIIITRDMDEKKIDGVVNKGKTRVSFKDSELKLEGRMIELRDKLTGFVGLPKVAEIEWRRSYVEFIKKVNSIGQNNNRNGVENSKHALTYTSESPEKIIDKAINKLGEFTVTELQKETKIENRSYLLKKINAMVSEGTLVATGPAARRKYKRVIVSKPLF